MKPILVLWDIDHTLIKTGGVGREVFAEAFEQTTGQPMRDMADPAGLTEPVIFAKTLELHGIDDADELFPKFATAQAESYRRNAEEMRTRGRVLPGAIDALRLCKQDPDVTSTVLTGNPRPSALAKLEIFELDAYLDLESGAYGDDAPDRAELVRVAWQRAGERHEQEFGPTSTMIVGDTPNDVAAARANGAFVVGVTSGKSTAEALKDAGANSTVQDLTMFEAAFPYLRGAMDLG